MYDYYPFGMPMLERSTSDTGTQTAYVSQVVYSPQYTTVNNAMVGASITSPNTTLQTNGNGIVSYTGPKAGIKKVLSNLIPNVPVRVKINLVYSSKPMYIAVAEGSAQSPSVYSNLLYSTMSNGSINFIFTPTQPSVELSMRLFYISTPFAPLPYMSFTLDSVSYTQQTGTSSSTQLVQISNKLKGGYRFGYGNHEKIDEIAGAGNTLDFGARIYDSRIGRFKSVDPLAHLMPFASPYAYCLNNPINMIDPDGRIPYPITIRAFAPFNYFGGGFHGDGSNRGFTTSSSATARVHQKINFDTDKTTMTTNAWSSPTSHRVIPGSLTGTPAVNFTGDFTISQKGDAKTFGFGTHVAGSNPMVPGAPPIDVFSNFSITENKKAGTLNISGKLTGDNFPSTEAFVTDPSGNNVFIGVGFYEGSPFSSLDGENKRDVSSFNFSISTDKKGNFTGVKMGDKSYSLGDWNKMFQTADPHKDEEKK